MGARTATLVDAIYLLFYLFMIASAEVYYRMPVAAEARHGPQRHRLQAFSPLPYVAVAGTYGLLLAAVLSPWQEPISGIAVCAVLLTILVVSRQFLAVRENVRLLAENAARQNEARFRSLVQHSSDVMIVVRPDSTIQFVSPSVTRVLRYEIEPLMGRPLIELLQPEDRERARAFFRDAARTPGVTPPIEWSFRQPDGSSLHAEVIATNLLHESTVRGLVLNTRDVSERKRLEKQLTHQAFHDPLTGLANRALFRDRVSHGLALARRDGRSLSVLFLDLDDFKKVNDSLGHHEGDRLLVAAAERLESTARDADTVARLGGDEFAILIENVVESGGPLGLAQRLTAAMARPFMLSGNEVQINASIGIASSTGFEDADDLLRNADVAMYTAKRLGKGRSEVFQSQMYAEIRERLELEAALRHAIEERQLTLVYQPIVSLQGGRIFGVEALVRWDHPKLGPLLPHQFVPLAEETGLVVPLGRWVLREACAQIRRWRTTFPTIPLSVAVNVSGRQLHELDVVDETRAALEESGVDPSALVLEITESVLMQQAGSVLARLEQLKELGVSLSIDDFGIGYSSLSYLQRFPIDILKIAKPFVDDVARGPERAALARAIVGLGDTLHLHTIAEGIETAEQSAALIALGCAYGQGYYFSPPLPAEGIEALLATPATVPAGGVWR
jgi:diguanylate cyclase (GGDEF)-like protein/PAS domain S-box-containing protein